jgi:small subunit ribosomal protein S1
LCIMDDAQNTDSGFDNDNLSEFARLLDEVPGYSPFTLRRGEIRSAIILEIKAREIIVDLNAKRDGIVRVEDLVRLDDEFRESLSVGDEIPVYILNPRDYHDNLIVSINMGLQRYDWDKARELLTSDDVVTVRVTGNNRGGILVRWNRLEGFIPSSHLASVGYSSDRRDAWNELMDRELTVKVIEVDQDRRRLIFSEREAQKEWRAQQKIRLLAELSEGDVVKGTVTGLRDFGAFVNLGGADGLIHVSELAWHRVDHPRDILTVGSEIEVYILNLDRESNRIALSRKRLLRDPWEDAATRYHEGQLIEGIVTNVVDFGAFVALDNGLEGLLHLSEMGNGTLKEPYSYMQKSDRLSLRISHLEPEKRRVGFTQRWGTDVGDEVAEDATEKAATEDEVADEFADAPAAVDEIDEAVGEDSEEEIIAETEIEDVPPATENEDEVAEGSEAGEITETDDSDEN